MKNAKIIGFTISPVRIDHSDIDIFKIGFSYINIKKNGYFIYLWGIGNLRRCFIDSNTISLSFPLNDKLDDRNVIITLQDRAILIENDWLGSIPIFYNSSLRIVSTLFNKCNYGNSFTLDKNGLYGYLDFGYSVFERTPVFEVKFLKYFSRIILKKELTIKYKDDKYLKYIYSRKICANYLNVIRAIKNDLSGRESRIFGNIVIPTSGGYDSRFLNILIDKKERIRAFTYGLAPGDKNRSSEVVFARYIGRKLKVFWREIKLGHFIKYFRVWYQMYGLSNHLHGMYHIEFYQKIRKLHKNNTDLTVLSGIFGDVWSGSVDPEDISNYKEVWKMGYTHDLRVSPLNLNYSARVDEYKKYYFLNKKYIDNKRTHIVMLIRLKLILISYLMSVPDYMGLPSWSPFLSFDIVSKLLSIDPKLHKKRIWQEKYFKSLGLFPEEMNLKYTTKNLLDYNALRHYKIPNINITIMKKYFKASYLLRLYFAYLRLTLFGDVKCMWAFNQLCILKNIEIALSDAII